MRLGPPAAFCHSPFHIIQKCTAPIKKYLRFCSLMLPTYTDNKALSGERWSCCHRWVSSCVPYCGLWCPCVGEMNVLACSYHCWFPGRLNGRCSGAVRMNGWPLSSHDNLLPTALILHRGHWSASYWFFLFLSFFPSFSSSLYLSLSLSDLSALAKKIKLEAMASYNSNQQHGGPNGENGDHNPGLGESCPHTCCKRVTCLITVV